ncbi:hypothetical protein BpHYR1_019343, partial [Brachionus plicatilis]
ICGEEKRWKLVSRKPFFRIFCSTSFRFIDKLVLFLNSSFNANKRAQYPYLKKSFCAEHFEIVLNGYFFVLKREILLDSMQTK